jgi:hypothetical protein
MVGDRTSGVAMQGESITWYAFAFDGAPEAGLPVPGWTELPDEAHQVAARARRALAHARSAQVRVYRCRGIALPSETVWCDDAALIADLDASECLARFARYCAAAVQVLWTPPALVAEYIATGDPAVRPCAYQLASTCVELLAGAQKMAARVAMFALRREHAVIATREAASLSAQLLGASSTAATRLACVRQERFLASTLLAEVPRDRISRNPIPEVALAA